MSADAHLTAGEYVLLYATKRIPHTLTDRHTGREKHIWSDTSTWTWRIRGGVLAEIRGSIDACCRSLALGLDPTQEATGSGLRALLAAQRARPLFAGVRNQVIGLHRYASDDAWPRFRPAWVAGIPRAAQAQGSAWGSLLSDRDLIEVLPKMRQLRVYDNPPRTIRDLLTHSSLLVEGGEKDWVNQQSITSERSVAIRTSPQSEGAEKLRKHNK